MPGQFILHTHAEHTAADHATDHAKFLTHDKQNLIRKAVKTAPMNTASELIKNVQESIPNSENLSLVLFATNVPNFLLLCATAWS